MAEITLVELLDRARKAGGYVNSRIFTDEVMTPWANEAHGDFCDLLDDHMNGWRDISATVTCTANVATVDLPAGTITVRRADVVYAGEEVGLHRWDPGLANRLSRPGLPVAYLHARNTLELFPAPDAAYELKLRLVPEVEKLVDGTDTIDVPNGWEEYHVQQLLLRCYEREERDQSAVMTKIARLEKRIAKASERRDTTGPSYLSFPHERRRLRLR